MTPEQLKEHNTMLLLQKQKKVEMELKQEEQEKERQNKIDEMLLQSGTIPELEKEIEDIKEDIEELEEGIDNLWKEIEIINNSIEQVWQQIATTKNSIVEIKNNIDISEKKLSDKIEQEIEEVYKTTSEIKNKLISLKDNDRKPKVERIIEKVELLKDLARLSDIPNLQEYVKRDEVYNKEEVYNKREIDSKLQSTQWGKRYTEIKDDITDWYFTRSSEKIQEQIDASSWPSYTPFISITNAERDALTPTIGYIVYCTDEVEWLYIYTSDWRQRFNMAIVM